MTAAEFRYRRVALVGLGPHAQRIYFPLLADLAKRGAIELTHVFELHGRKTTVERLLDEAHIGTEAIFLSSEADALSALERACAIRAFDALIIACDPLCREPYYKFALRNRIAVLADKPVFALPGLALDPMVASEFLRQTVALAGAFSKSGIPFVVQAQRRVHPGYRWMKNYLQNVSQEFGVPVTSVHIQHADGMWVLPDEWDREHHPYKYGFGKLMHSGYHFVDLLCWLLGMTDGDPYDAVELAGKGTWPAEALALWQGNALVPPEHRVSPKVSPESLGEYDVSALLQFRSEGRPKTQAHLQLQHNSFSDRDPRKIVTDPYKGTGRVRHERVDLKLSSLVNLQVHSYQSASTSEPTGTAPGQRDHFDLYVFRNIAVCGGEAFTKLSFGQAQGTRWRSHNEAAREELLLSFLRGEETGSELSSHLTTVQLVSYLYELVAKQREHFSTIQRRLGRDHRGG
ncbi:MAG TPA: hypothetical protein PKA58_10225 [Polyangium sp.]|nr:hypothetical protein [Polyangium sp.]